MKEALVVSRLYERDIDGAELVALRWQGKDMDEGGACGLGMVRTEYDWSRRLLTQDGNRRIWIKLSLWPQDGRRWIWMKLS